MHVSFVDRMHDAPVGEHVETRHVSFMDRLHDALVGEHVELVVQIVV